MKSGDVRKEKDQSREVSNARGRLEGALQILADRTESESEIESDSETADFGGQDLKRSLPRSPLSSPRKATPLSVPPSKKRRRITPKKKPAEQQSFVLKLYDRSVDLAAFSPDTPLYPVCRAWIKNDPTNLKLGNKTKPRNEERTQNEASSDDKEPRDVYSLPPPQKMPHDSEGNVVDLRIPENSKTIAKSANLDFLKQETLPSDKELLAEHLQHWWGVRQQWRQAAAKNESRYSQSIKTIKEIFERNST